MPDPRLIVPHDVEGAIVDVISRRHPEHLAAEERRRGVAAETFQRLVTIARMSDGAAVRLSGDTMPCCLLGVIGAPTFERNEDNGIDAVLQLGMQVSVLGQKRRDTLYRRDVTAWTVIECMYQRVPRDGLGLVDSLRLVDYEPLAEADTQRTVGDARIVWEIGVANVLTITGGLPTDDSEWPTEGGGPPEDPYDPIEPRPTAVPTFTLDRLPIAE